MVIIFWREDRERGGGEQRDEGFRAAPYARGAVQVRCNAAGMPAEGICRWKALDRHGRSGGDGGGGSGFGGGPGGRKGAHVAACSGGGRAPAPP